jgi:hypothetical protein
MAHFSDQGRMKLKEFFYRDGSEPTAAELRQIADFYRLKVEIHSMGIDQRLSAWQTRDRASGRRVWRLAAKPARRVFPSRALEKRRLEYTGSGTGCRPFSTTVALGSNPLLSKN